jgi:peptidoglycan-associated lipoprotein
VRLQAKISTKHMNKIYRIFGASFLALILVLSSCGGGVTLSKADEAKKRMQYKYAADLYTVLAPKIKDKKEQQRAREEAAYCYSMANMYEKALRSYEKVLRKDPKNTEALYQAGVMNIKIAGDCNKEALKEARAMFVKYLEEVPNDERAMRRIASIDSSESWKAQIPNSRFKVSNFKVANTKGMDYSPMIASKRDDLLYFSSDRDGGLAKKKVFGQTGGSFSDLWFVKAKKGRRNSGKTWDKQVTLVEGANTKFNDGSCVFDRRYSTMYYTQCNGADGKSIPCKIYQAKLIGTTWSEEQMLSFCANDTFDYGHPALSSDGKTLYFSSNRPDGEGNYDIWCVTYNQRAKSWGEPFNLGNTINTEEDEMFPYLNTHDGNLYFSSNGHFGIGGLDIFRSEGTGTEWTEPENLRAPLNSGGDDFGMTFDNTNPDHGFFTSDRCDSKGSYDIYEFDITPLIIEIEGYVYECNPGSTAHNLSKPLANSTIILTNDKDSTKIELKTDEKGYYSKTRLREKANYEISCTNRELYYFDHIPVQRTTVGIKNSIVLKQDFCLKSQIVIMTVPIFYPLDKANITPQAAQVLQDSILTLMNKYPKLRMELGSHTDCRSSYAYNIDLSQRRADSAVNWLVQRGINPRRLIAKGYGESQPVNDCKCEGAVKSKCSEAEHSVNRRTTFRTLDVDFDPNMKDETNDPNNRNSQPILLKVEKKDANFTVDMAGNDIDAKTPGLITNGADNYISMAELKNLLLRKLITQDQLTGITVQDIMAGRLKPNSTVKLNSLRFGAKDVRSFTALDVVLKINNSPNPYTIGKDGLKTTFSGSLNEDEGELTFENKNTEALKGGPVGSKILDETPQTAPAAVDTVSLESYKQVNLIVEGDALFVPTMINGTKQLNWKYDETSRKIEIPEDIAVELYESGVISKGDFEDGNKITTASGKKLPSNTFTIEKLELGGVTLENVKVTISNRVTEPTFGAMNSTFKKLKAVVKYKILFLFEREKRK